MAELSEPPVRVLVVDDDPLVRTGLRLLLAGDRSIEIVAEASDGDQVRDLVTTHQPDVILMDIRMPRLDGIETTRRVTAADPHPAVIMLTTFDADATVLTALRAGAAGFLLKHAPPDQIIGGMHSAVAGEPVFSSSVLHTLVAHARDNGDATDRTASDQAANAAWDRLTDRERDIAAAVSRGLSNADIARELYLSTGTVKADISDMLAGLGLTNRIQLAILAARLLGPS